MTAPQMQLFSPDQTFVHVEFPDGTINRVSVSEIDKPGAPAYIRDWLSNNKNSFYNAKSGLHKEIRRGDFARARAFALQVERFKRGEARRYMRHILFEETQNLRILDAYNKRADLRDMVQMMCRSVKDWEVKDDPGICGPRWYRVVRKYDWYGKPDVWTEKYPWPKDPVDALNTWLKKGDTASIMDMAIMCTNGNSSGVGVRREVRRTMSQVAADMISPKWRDAVLSLGSDNHPEGVICLAHIIAGEWTDEYTELNDLNRGQRVEVCRMPPYILDSHTRDGRKTWHQRKHMVSWGDPLPDGVDVRWSGNDCGTLWRYLAIEQHGTCDVPWESVTLPPDVQAIWSATYPGIIA